MRKESLTTGQHYLHAGLLFDFGNKTTACE